MTGTTDELPGTEFGLAAGSSPGSDTLVFRDPDGGAYRVAALATRTPSVWLPAVARHLDPRGREGWAILHSPAPARIVRPDRRLGSTTEDTVSAARQRGVAAESRSWMRSNVVRDHDGVSPISDVCGDPQRHTVDSQTGVPPWTH